MLLFEVPQLARVESFLVALVAEVFVGQFSDLLKELLADLSFHSMLSKCSMA